MKIEDITIKIGQYYIVRTDNYKYLGITVDEKLTWKKHIGTLKNKISSIVEAIRRADITITRTARILLIEDLC